VALGSTQPLTEMSTRDLIGGKGQPARKADNITAICEPPRPVTGIALPFLYLFIRTLEFEVKSPYPGRRTGTSACRQTKNLSKADEFRSAGGLLERRLALKHPVGCPSILLYNEYTRVSMTTELVSRCLHERNR
jgi:hypothetical protein